MVTGPWRGPSVRGFAYTDQFPAAAWLPLIPGTRIHWPTLALGVVLAAGCAVLLARTRLGFAIRVQGENPEAARYVGINALRTTLLGMLLSGGAAGGPGAGEGEGGHPQQRRPHQASLPVRGQTGN